MQGQTHSLVVGSSRGKTRKDVGLRKHKLQELASACSRPCSRTSSAVPDAAFSSLRLLSCCPRAWSWKQGLNSSEGVSLTLLFHDKCLDSHLNTPNRGALLLDRLNYI